MKFVSCHHCRSAVAELGLPQKKPAAESAPQHETASEGKSAAQGKPAGEKQDMEPYREKSVPQQMPAPPPVSVDQPSSVAATP